MATRLITSTLRQANGAPLAFAEVIFRLVDDTFTLSPDEHFPARPLRTTTDSEGRLEVTLVSGLDEQYEVTLPDGETFLITVADGSDITLEELRADAETAPVPLITLQTLIEQYIDDSGFVGTEVQEGGAGSIFPASIIDFAAAPFVVTESPSGHANVSLDLAATAGKPMPGNAALDDLSDVTITTPAANQYLTRNSGNTAWVNSAGVVHPWLFIESALFGGVNAVSRDGVFSGTYDWYKLVVAIYDFSTASAGLTFQFRTSGVTIGSAIYDYTIEEWGTDTVSSRNPAEATVGWDFNWTNAVDYLVGELDFAFAASVLETWGFMQSVYSVGPNSSNHGSAINRIRANNVFDGFRLSGWSAATIQGRYWLYARKSS